MIKFITEQEKTENQFQDVEENQFFINCFGYLCQKTNDVTYTIIADSYNMPFSDTRTHAKREDKIGKILPKVTKIEFK